MAARRRHFHGCVPDVNDQRALLDKKGKRRERKTHRMKIRHVERCRWRLWVEDTQQPWFQDNTPVILTANLRNAASSTLSSSDERLPTKSTIHEMDKAEQQNVCRLAAVNWRTINVSTAAFTRSERYLEISTPVLISFWRRYVCWNM